MGFVSVEDRQPATPPNTERAQYRRRSITRKQPGQFPRHPIPQLQGPFEESILEAGEEDGDKWVVDIDAQSRRRDLLGNAGYERLCGRKWRQRPSERQATTGAQMQNLR